MPLSLHILHSRSTTPLTEAAHREAQLTGGAEGLQSVLNHVGSGTGVFETYMTMMCLDMAEPVALIIFSGLLERFPGLSFAIAESGIGWIPFTLERMDGIFHTHRNWMQSVITKPPSEYFHEHFFATFQQDDDSGILGRYISGVDNLMWASDYPHTDTTFRSPARWSSNCSLTSRLTSARRSVRRTCVASTVCQHPPSPSHGPGAQRRREAAYAGGGGPARRDSARSTVRPRPSRWVSTPQAVGRTRPGPVPYAEVDRAGRRRRGGRSHLGTGAGRRGRRDAPPCSLRASHSLPDQPCRRSRCTNPHGWTLDWSRPERSPATSSRSPATSWSSSRSDRSRRAGSFPANLGSSLPLADRRVDSTGVALATGAGAPGVRTRRRSTSGACSLRRRSSGSPKVPSTSPSTGCAPARAVRRTDRHLPGRPAPARRPRDRPRRRAAALLGSRMGGRTTR